MQSKRKFDAELKTITVKTAPTNQRTGDVNWFRVENTIGDQFYQTSTGTGVPITRQWETALNDALSQSLIFRDNAQRKISLIVEIQKVEMNGLATVDYDIAARYRLMDRETGVDAYSKTIESHGSAETSEAFVGAVRARLAFVRSVKTNIEQFLADLQTAMLQ
ncbi:hypothetical protein SKTS_06100 [Sulfurimicrobium lacus]|uniref:ABC-type transport auxiliary lipoprotein component domain-containing protein n=2 Tax=Sulfurimicrobium lacus TaxID=2715678 RepID=A0A6F8V7T4_9PROT|nr:hypothetical protein SKTS_06100 [Sulfurimicrobium lacus]